VIPRLPFTQQEATRLLALAPRTSSFGAIDFQASRATVLGGGLGQYRYVHFATHGLLNTERPQFTGLVLSLVGNRDADGFLRTDEIFNLRLGAQLVVLSACETGLGREKRGEGVIGLTRAFMYAGAPRVVASLWSVNDAATAELMKRFYQGMLGPKRLSPPAALRAAQLGIQKEPRWRAPYYWAAFVIQGEWR
jgi:CHAT domain-containing protein